MNQSGKIKHLAHAARGLLAAILALTLAATQAPLTTIAYAAPSASSQSTVVRQPSVAEMLAAGPYVEHEAIVLMRDGGTLKQKQLEEAEEELTSVSSKALAEAPTIDALTQNSDERNTSDTGARVTLVRDESKSTEQLLEELLADEAVITAEPNYLVPEIEDDSTQQLEEALDTAFEDLDTIQTLTATDGAPALTATPNPIAENTSLTPSEAEDGTRFQWGNRNAGNFAGAGTKGIDINYDGWNEGSSTNDGPVIAILDTGIDGTHPDLKDKLWVDTVGLTGSITGADEHGFSVSDEKSTEGIGAAQGHGTHVAGIVGAAWDEAGASGVSKDARLMAVRHNDTFAGIFACFDYINEAQKRGVKVVAINASLGVGGGTSSILDAIIADIGLGPNKDGNGAITIFAAGNSGTNADDSACTSSLFSENPYVVIVDSADADGGLSPFSHYGERTNDFAAPGSASLSTWPTAAPNYLGELDGSPAIYESFEDGIAPQIVFQDASTTDDRSFDGSKSLVMETEPGEEDGVLGAILSDPIDISTQRAAGNAQYLSIRYASECFDDCSIFESDSIIFEVALYMEHEGQPVVTPLESAGGKFQAMAGSWGGASYALPDSVSVENADGTTTDVPVDYSNLCLALDGQTLLVSFLEQATSKTPSEGRAFIDSISIGSNMVAYAYMQGTSMAAPETSGVAAVVAQEKGIYGQELAARLRGSTTAHNDKLAGTSLSGGMIDAQKALTNPGPAITATTLSSDGSTINIEGYYFGSNKDDLTVKVAGMDASVEALVSYGSLQTIKVSTPASFTGGQVEIIVKKDDDAARAFPYLSPAQNITRFPHSLALPQAIDQWDKAQLAGYNGYIWAAPQISGLRIAEEYAAFERYSIASNVWETVMIPAQVIASVSDNGESGMVAGMSITAWDGNLAVLLTGQGGESSALWTIDANDTWSKIGVWGGPDEEILHAAGALASTDKGDLWLIGALKDGSTPVACRFDAASDSWISAGELDRTIISPNVSYSNNSFVISSGSNLRDQGFNAGGAELLTIKDDGTIESSPIDLSAFYTETGSQVIASAAVADGYMLIGPACDADKYDSYMLNAAGETSAYALRASELALLSPTAVGYDGKVYVLSRVQGGTENGGFIFMATDTATNPTPGDVAASPAAPEKPGTPGTPVNSTLAKTGDSTTSVILALSSAAAFAVLALAILAARKKRTQRELGI